MKTNTQDGKRHILTPSLYSYLKIIYARKCVEKLTQAKYDQTQL